MEIPARLTIERAALDAINVYGGDSPHTGERPFVIDLAEVREPADVIAWMSRLATRGWGATPRDLTNLARLLLDRIGERQDAGRE